MLKKCFFICPIGEDESDIRKHSDQILKYLLTPVCDEKQYEVIRADKINSANKISADIVNHLENDELAIADLTGHNPNVFYEIGYRKAKNMPTIHIAKLGTKLPFDTTDDRTIFFNLNDLESVDEFKQKLSETIDSIPTIKNDLKILDNNISFSSIKQTPNAQSLESKIIEYAQNNNSQGHEELFNLLQQIVFEKNNTIYFTPYKYSSIKNKIKILENLKYVEIQEFNSGASFVKATLSGINLILYGNPTSL